MSAALPVSSGSGLPSSPSSRLRTRLSMMASPIALLRKPIVLVPIVLVFTLIFLLKPSSSSNQHPYFNSLSNFGAAVPNVFLFLPINKAAAGSNTRFCNVVTSAVVNGWTPILYNWEMTGSRSHLLKNKVFGMAKILASPTYTSIMKEDDLVFLVDALDVWLQLSPEAMARRFLEYGSDIVIGADKMCWPNPKNTHDCTAAPLSPLPMGLFHSEDSEKGLKGDFSNRPRHANSGTVLGRLHKMRELYPKLVEIMESERYKNFHSDQGAFNMLLGDGYLHVDPYFRLFWVSAYDTDNIAWVNTPRDPDAPMANPTLPPTSSDDSITPWSLYPTLIHHKLTGEVPVAIHLNDHAHKKDLENWWGRHWWSSNRTRFTDLVQRRMTEGQVKIVTEDGYSTHGVQEICPKLKIWEQIANKVTAGDDENPEDGLE